MTYRLSPRSRDASHCASSGYSARQGRQWPVLGPRHEACLSRAGKHGERGRRWSWRCQRRPALWDITGLCWDTGAVESGWDGLMVTPTLPLCLCWYVPVPQSAHVWHLTPRPQLIQCSEALGCCLVHVAYVPVCLRTIRKGRERGSTGLWSSCRDPLYFSPIGQKLVTWLARSWSCCHTSADVGNRGLPSGQPCSQTLKSRAPLLLRKHELMLREELFVSGPS